MAQQGRRGLGTASPRTRLETVTLDAIAGLFLSADPPMLCSQNQGGCSVEQKVVVITGVIESREPDVYTRPGSRDRIASYYGSLGVDA